MADCAADCLDSVDPRVQVELERLNTSTDDINKLEVDLDEARLIFRQLLLESSLRGQALGRKLGACIDRARPYYEARFQANKALQELRAAAVLYEKANSAHAAAREMVYLAEQGLCKLCESGGGAGGVPLDPAWQEMLNHATARVNQAEAERGSAGARHRAAAEAHRAALAAARALQQSLKRHITKSRPYFEEKARYNSQLDSQKGRVQQLEKEVAAAKVAYAQALRNLETISEEIHRHRSRHRAQHQPELSNGTEKKPEPPEPKKLTNGVKAAAGAGAPKTPPSPTAERQQLSKSDSIRQWIQQTGAASPDNGFEELPEDAAKEGEAPLLPPSLPPPGLARPGSLPCDFADKFSDGLTPRVPHAPDAPTTEVPAASAGTPSTDNWIEINLEYSSPEEVSFSRCSNFSSLERYRQVPYERLAAEPPSPEPRSAPPQQSAILPETPGVPNSKVSADSPRRIIRGRLAAQPSRDGAPREPGSPRRPSLDVLLNDTGEKVKEIFNQGFMMFQISSLTERRGSEPRSGDGSTRGRKPPSPLDKSLAHLSSRIGDGSASDDQGSDTESLASVEMLSEEQIRSLMLDGSLQAACRTLLVPPEPPEPQAQAAQP